MVGAQSIYACAQIAEAQNVGQLRTLAMCVIMLGSAWHGPSGERGVGLMSKKGVAPGVCMS